MRRMCNDNTIPFYSTEREARREKKREENKHKFEIEYYSVRATAITSRFGCGTEITVWSVQRLSEVFFPRK